MKFKKIILVTFLLLAILTIGVVSAAENTNDAITDNVIGSDETRAWHIQEGTTASKAAGSIHTDFEKTISAGCKTIYPNIKLKNCIWYMLQAIERKK